jgi:hypothetical protein
VYIYMGGVRKNGFERPAPIAGESPTRHRLTNFWRLIPFSPPPNMIGWALPFRQDWYTSPGVLGLPLMPSCLGERKAASWGALKASGSNPGWRDV